MTASSADNSPRVQQSLRVQPRLSPQAVRFVARHPELLDSLIAVALEAAAAQDAGEAAAQDSLENPSELSAAPVLPETLQRFVRPSANSDPSLLNISEAAKLLQISRPTIYAWIADKRLLGWQATHRGPVIPAGQILGPRSVVPGLPQLLEIIPDPAVAWDFLRQDSAFLDPPQRPIDALKAGLIAEVAAAARSHGTAFT
jgi:predicted DNA-binding transcriptional regulator AlpA